MMKIENIMEYAMLALGSEGSREVCFVRALGQNASLADEFGKAEAWLGCEMAAGKLQYKRVEQLRMMMGSETAEYLAYYENWLASGKYEMNCRVIEKRQELNGVLAKACDMVLQEYVAANPQATESMQRNVIVKCLFWFDDVMQDVVLGIGSPNVVKIIGRNVVKEQEYLFYYLLALVGADVLLLQHEQDVKTKELLLRLSSALVIGEFGACNIVPFDKEALLKSVKSKTLDERIHNETDIGNVDRGIQNAFQSAVQDAISQAIAPDNAEQNRTEKTFKELASLHSSVVLIEVLQVGEDYQQVAGYGSGIMIGRDGYIMTNAHIVTRGNVYAVRIKDDEQVYVTSELIKYHSLYDIAVIRINRKLQPLPVYSGTETLRIGQKVVAIGSTRGMVNAVSEGTISEFSETVKDLHMIHYSAPSASGGSGGALLNEKGEVIGMNTAESSGGQNYNLAVSYETFYPFIAGFLA